MSVLVTLVLALALCVARIAASPRLAYTVEEAAEAIGLSRKAIYGQIAAGRIRVARLGKKILVPRAELDRVLALPAKPRRRHRKS